MLEDSDYPEIFSLRSDVQVNRYIERVIPANEDEAKAFINKINDGIEGKNWFYWAICLRENQRLIGTICLWNFADDGKTAEIGFELNPDQQGQGIMQEALKSVIEYGLNEAGLKTILAFTHNENLRSSRLLQKNHFIVDLSRKDPDNLNNVAYCLVRKEN